MLALPCGRRNGSADWGPLFPMGGDRRRGTARLLRAAEMRPKTSGGSCRQEGGGSSGNGEAGESCGAGGVLVGPEESAAPARSNPGVVPPNRWWGGQQAYWPRAYWPLIYRAPPVSQEVKRWAFLGSGVVRPQCRGGPGAHRPRGVPRSGVMPGGLGLGMPERPGGPVQARRTAPLLLLAGPAAASPRGVP